MAGSRWRPRRDDRRDAGEITEIWEDDVGPEVAGTTRAAGRRRSSTPPSPAPPSFGDGWIAGGAPPEEFAEAAEKVKGRVGAAGREGAPRLEALAYFSLGDGAEENANEYLTDYYAWLGEETANYIAGRAAKDAETVKGYIAAFEGRRLRRADPLPLRQRPGPGRPAGRRGGTLGGGLPEARLRSASGPAAAATPCSASSTASSRRGSRRRRSTAAPTARSAS